MGIKNIIMKLIHGNSNVVGENDPGKNNSKTLYKEVM